jgi:hypothetical protein
MTKDQFYAQLRQFAHREPFAPFVVELRDGRRLVINEPPIAFGNEAAGFIDPQDGALVDFYHDEVTSFGLLEQGAPA